jgi:hypothetical protein
MKIRLGYVSNSSAASYLIAIAIVKKEFIENVKEWLKKIPNWKIEFNEIIEDEEKNFSVESFNCDVVSLKAKKGDYVIGFCDRADADYIDEDCTEISEADWSDFDEQITLLLEQTDWFENHDVSYGSGYDG